MIFIYCKNNHTFLILLVLVLSCIKNNSHGIRKETTSHSKPQKSEDPENIQDLSKGYQQESIRILPIAEIIRRANLSYFTYSPPTTEETTADITTDEETITLTVQETTAPKTNIILRPLSSSTIKILLKGTKIDIMKISYTKIMRNLKYVDSINLSLDKKLLLWGIIKRKKNVADMDRGYMERLYGLVYNIPENEYIYINTSDWNVVDFFGTSKLLTRRRAAIIAYALKHRHGDVIIQDFKFINKLKGLICGFSQTDLKNISTYTFKRIHESVFSNLWPCTSEQMNVLLDTAQKPDTYGAFEIWNENIFRKIGFLVTVIKVEDFSRFNANVFDGLVPEIIDIMSDDQRQWLNDNVLVQRNENMLINNKRTHL